MSKPKGSAAQVDMAMTREGLGPRAALALILFGWLLGLAQFVFHAVAYTAMGRDVPWDLLSWTALRYGIGAFALPWLVGRAWRERFDRRRWFLQLPAHLGRAAVVATGVLIVFSWTNRLVVVAGCSSCEIPQLLDQILRGVVLSDIYRFGVISIAATAVRTALDFRSKEFEATRLQSELATTKLRLLKTQLDPHFLFNTLNLVSNSVTRDPEAAERMLSRLSDLLRLLLESGGREEVSVSEELEYLETYVEIQQTRFRERLKVTVTAPSDVLDRAVPMLLLQPLVENAVRHGMLPRRRLSVAVAVHQAGGMLHLAVENDGRDFGEEAGAADGGRGPRGAGVGLVNTRARLQTLYGEDQSLIIERRPGGGTQVRVALPLRSLDSRSAHDLSMELEHATATENG